MPLNRTLSATLAVAALAVAGAATLAVRPAVSQTTPTAATQTVWLAGKGKADFADRMNRMHAEMSAKGFRFVDTILYIEDGDMQGVFITYARD